MAVVAGERIARYGFPGGHPFGPDRHAAFMREFDQRGLREQVRLLEPVQATSDDLLLFHTADYVQYVRERSEQGGGALDAGDTPAYRGVYEAAACVVGASLVATDWILGEAQRRAFVPIAAPVPVSEAWPVPGYRLWPLSCMSANIRSGSASKA